MSARDGETVLNAWGKINLGLDVVGVRPDGYHEVKMILSSIRLHDVVTIRREKESGIRLASSLSFLPVDRTNLAWRAAEGLLEEFHVPEGVSITLEKHIPVSAGLAGGSADAAAVLKGVNRLFHLGLSKEDLLSRGAALGADIPFCLTGGTMLAEGIGEKLTALPDAPGRWVLLAKPPYGLSTKRIYERFDPDDPAVHPDMDALIKAVREGDFSALCAHMGNALSGAAGADHPEIEKIRVWMLEHGAKGALMSGSGPTVFGLFEDGRAAHAAADAGRREHLAKQIIITQLYHKRRKEHGGTETDSR